MIRCNLKIGDKINNLTIISNKEKYYTKSGKRDGYKFLCQCKCGNESYYDSSKLVNNKFYECSNCIRFTKESSKFLIGDKYYDLTVVNNIPKIRKILNSHEVKKYILCQCKCGSIKYYQTSHLKTKRAKRCSFCAYKLKPHKLSILEKLYQSKITKSCKQSKGKKISTLTVEEFSNIINKNCFYCGDLPIKLKYLYGKKLKDNNDIFSNGVDRIDSLKGYSKENCVPCCEMCNRMKLNYDIQQFKNQIIKIYNKWIN